MGDPRPAGYSWPAGEAADLISNVYIEISGPNNSQNRTPITIYLSFLLKNCAAGDPLPASGAADLISNGVIEISGPNNPRIDTNNDISVISCECWCGSRWPFAGAQWLHATHGSFKKSCLNFFFFYDINLAKNHTILYSWELNLIFRFLALMTI